jgi:hypothetical protein
MSVSVVSAVTLLCASTLLAATTAPVLMAMMVMDSTVQMGVYRIRPTAVHMRDVLTVVMVTGVGVKTRMREMAIIAQVCKYVLGLPWYMCHGHQ